MSHRRCQLCISLLILSNLLLQSCQVSSSNICTEEVLPDLNQNAEASCRGTLSRLSSRSPEGAGSLDSESFSAPSGQVQISVSTNKSLAVARSATLSGGLFSEQVASLSDMQTASTAVHGFDVCPTSTSSIVQDLDPLPPVPFRSYQTSSGECVSFRQVAGHWQAALLRPGFDVRTSERIVPVVSKEDIGETLSWLQVQDPCISRSRVHLLSQFGAPYNLCVYLGKYGLLGGMPKQEKEPGLLEKYYHERAEREKLQKEQVVLREIYEGQLRSLEQTNEKYQRAYEELQAEHSNLKSDIEGLEDYYRQTYEATFTSLARERDMYRNQYEKLQAEHSGLKSEVEELEDYYKRHEATFISLARERDMYEDQCDELRAGYSDLKSEVEELEDYRQRHEATLASLARERNIYKDRYEELQAEYLHLKSYLTRYPGPERVLFQPIVSGAMFGKEEWARYLGDIGVEPPLPSDIDAILHSACPFWPDSEVKDTHLLVLIPATVHDRPFTLDLLEYLAENPRSGGHPAKCCYESDAVKREFGSLSYSCNSYWVLVTDSVLPDSQCRTIEEQEALVADYSRKTGLNYEIPSPLEAATVILSHYVRSGERICPDYPRVCTRCAGKVDHIYPVYMGLFSLEGLNIGIDDSDSSSLSCGTLCLRKL
jgi:conjugal transfer/entry exclusion protein